MEQSRVENVFITCSKYIVNSNYIQIILCSVSGPFIPFTAPSISGCHLVLALLVTLNRKWGDVGA